jgi:hypothetical protein
MKQTKLVIKRKSTGKHIVDNQSLDQSRLKADHLKSIGRGGGIIDALLPSNPSEQANLDVLKATFEVNEVINRDKLSQTNQELRDYINNNTFLVAIGKWFEKYFPGRITVDRISDKLSKAQKTIADEMVTEPVLVELKEILQKYAPLLLDNPREQQWWEAQITQKRKSLKKNRTKLKS